MKILKHFWIPALAFLAAGSARANNWQTGDWVDPSKVQLNGSASVVPEGGGTVLRLTENQNSLAGSAFWPEPVVLTADTSFSGSFALRISDSGGGGADGIVFVVQNNPAGPSALGGGGGGIGYGGITQSLGVEFDTFDNGNPTDINGNHVGLNFHGALESAKSASLDPLGQLDEGATFYAWIDYDGKTDQFDVRVNNGPTRPLDAILSANIDLPAVLGGKGYVGFTGATGGAYSKHDILSFQGATSAVPTPDSQSTFLALLVSAASLFLLGGKRGDALRAAR